MKCKKCGSENVVVQAVNEVKGRGILGSLIWLFLAFCTIGLILIIPMLTKSKGKTKTFAICQNCGHRWRV